MDCKSKTILGILLEAILNKNGQEIKRIIDLIKMGGKYAYEFRTELAKASTEVKEALRVSVPELV